MQVDFVPTALLELLDRFRALIIARGRTPKHADDTFRRAGRVLQEATITRLEDLRATQVELGLGRLRQRCNLSPVTLNHHLRATKSFSRYLMMDGVLSADPLIRLRPFNVNRDRRHRRRAMNLGEIRALLETAGAASTVRGMTGIQRRALYLLALTSGLRSNELRHLQVRDLIAGEPFIRLDAQWTKNGEDVLLPIPAVTAAAICDATAGRGGRDRMFSMPQCTRVVMMLRTDLKAAGIEYRNDQQEFADFHALRHTYLTHLVRLTTNLKLVQSLARHSTITLTIDRYCHAEASEQRKAVDSLALQLDLEGHQ